MTQIEFKVWNTTTNCFLNGIFTPQNDLGKTYRMNELVFCPSTNLEDSCNKKIFAGDILKSDVDDKALYGVVLYLGTYFMYHAISSNGDLQIGEIFKYPHFCNKSIIGNIFETPLYLTGKRKEDEILKNDTDTNESTKFVSLLQKICEEYGYEGGVLILDKFDDEGQRIATFGLSHLKTRECLSIASYYNEKLLTERGVDIDNPLNSFTYNEHESH